MQFSHRVRLSIILLTLLSGWYSLAALANDEDDIIKGGRLYDNWPVELSVDAPNTTHPAYPAIGKKKGGSTWRCKECHGWDYQGAKGAYATGSHFTGIKGILSHQEADTKKILSVLHDDKHGFDRTLKKDQLKQLALFVKKGLVDMTPFIDSTTKKIKGDIDKGARTYQKYCDNCHGGDGKALNLSHKKGKIVYVGGITNKNPWEILHKIRFGHPGATFDDDNRRHGMGNMPHHRSGAMGMHHSSMPPMYGEISLSSQVDLLAYMATLPKE